MGIAKEEYIKFTQKFIERLCRGDSKIREKYGTQMQWSLSSHNGFVRYANAQWQEALRCLSEGVKEVTHKDYYAAYLKEGHVIVSGIFFTHIKEPDILYQEHCYCTHVVFISGKIAYIEIEPKRHIGKRLELHNLDRESCFVWEDEILYIEVMQDHLYWKCRLEVLETTGTLLKLEKNLSEFFVRIHRSYIVNRNHVSWIRKYEVRMDNGDILQIPQRKYSEVKRKLQGTLTDT